jgi:MFS family permease
VRESLRPFREVIKAPGALRLLIAAVPTRVAYGMITLSLYFKVHTETGSIASAGVATGAYTLAAALTSGLRGSILDRFGITWPLRIFVPMYSISIFAVSLTADYQTLIFLAIIMGITAPPINLSVRPMWKWTVPRERLRTAYALDASSMRAVSIFSPVIATTVSLTISANFALQLCSALILLGGILLAPIKQIKAWVPEPKIKDELPIWRIRAFQFLIIEAAIIGFGRGAFEIAIPASATLAGVQNRVGAIFAVLALFYVIGGLLAGVMSHKISALRAYRGNYLLWALASIPLALVNLDIGIFIVVAFIGFFGGAAQVFYWEITEAIRPQGAAVKTIAWLWAIDGTAASLGITIGGYLSENFSPRYPLVITTLSIFIGLIVIACARNSLKAADRIVETEINPVL